MNAIDPALAVDALVAVLLVAVIVYAVLLNRRLKAWRGEGAEMARLLAEFGQSIARAEAALALLKAAVRDEGAALEQTRQRVQSLHGDLSYMLDRGSSLADRLEQGMRASLAQAGQALGAQTPAGEGASAPSDRARRDGEERMMSAAERQLIKALEEMR